MIAFPSGVIPPTPGQVPSFGAIGASLHTEVNIFNTCTHCLDSSLYPVLFYSCIPDRLLRPFKNDRQVFNTVEKKYFSFITVLSQEREILFLFFIV